MTPFFDAVVKGIGNMQRRAGEENSSNPYCRENIWTATLACAGRGAKSYCKYLSRLYSATPLA
jgi:hypothetical protein